MKNVLKSRIEFILLVLISIDFIYSGCCCKKKPSNNGSKTNSKEKSNQGSHGPVKPGGKKINITINENVGGKNKPICTVTIAPKATISELKFEIFKANNSLLSKKQKLTYNGVLLADDSKTLNECNINNGAVIIVEVDGNEEDINIDLRTVTGEAFNISVKPSETILELKKVASWKLGGGHNINNIKLIHAGKQLDDLHTIKEYNINNSKDKAATPTIHVIIRE